MSKEILERGKIKVMRWCLRVKLAQHWNEFGKLLLSTGQKPIVEESHKDVFGGAKRLKNGTLVGTNILGRFLMELRQELASDTSEQLRSVPVPDIPHFLLLGQPIGTIHGGLARGEKSHRPPEAGASSKPSLAVGYSAASNGRQLESNIASHSLWPNSTDADLTGSAGLHLVGLKVTGELHNVFRPKTLPDIGIDGEIEIRSKGKGNGRLVAVQVKGGPSYFRERTETGFVYRGSTTHLRYWLNYSIPVLVILCDLNLNACWWRLVDLRAIQFHKSGWSMEIPFGNRLDASAADQIRKISSRFQKRDIIDTLFKGWLLESHYYELALADILEQPRDYHWVRYLGRYRGRSLMADYVAADLKNFDLAEIDEMVRWAEANHRHFSYEKLILGLISETTEAFPIDFRPTVTEQGLSVELVPLLLRLADGPHLCEVGLNGHLITSYFDHRAVDDSSQEVLQQRIEISASTLA